MTDPVDSGHTSEGRVHGEGEAFDPAGHRPTTRAVAWVVAAALVAFGGLLLLGIVPRALHRTAMEADEQRAQGGVPRVLVAKVFREAPKGGLTLPGSVQPLQETQLYARANGYIRRWLVDIGAQVKKGQVVAELDIPDVDEQLRQAQAAESQARAGIAQARSQLELARTTNRRYTTLAPSGVVSQQEVEQYQSSFEVQQANVAAAEAAHVSAQANVHRYEDLKGFGTITAPFDGVVTMRAAEVGQLVTSGTGMGQALFKVAEVDVVRVFVNVPQLYAAGIRVGSEARVSIREMPGRVFTGRVARTANELDVATRSLLTEVDIPNGDRALVSGMYAQVSFTVERQDNPLFVPATAVLYDAKGTRVATVVSGRIAWKDVQVEGDFGDRLAIATGVALGDIVAVTPSGRLVEGMTVRTEEAKREATGSRPATSAANPAADDAGKGRAP